jgi:hypothetical protein
MSVTTVTQAPAMTEAADAPGTMRKFPAKSRVQLDLTPRAMALLLELKEKTEAPSYAEVFKNAVKLYDGIITEVEKGSEFLIRDKDGRVSEFRMFL